MTEHDPTERALRAYASRVPVEELDELGERVSAGPTFAMPGDDAVDYRALEAAARRERRMRRAARMWR
jgi:hypothetical protein